MAYEVVTDPRRWRLSRFGVWPLHQGGEIHPVTSKRDRQHQAGETECCDEGKIRGAGRGVEKGLNCCNHRVLRFQMDQCGRTIRAIRYQLVAIGLENGFESVSIGTSENRLPFAVHTIAIDDKTATNSTGSERKGWEPVLPG
jgi:hypothetical protein